MTNQPFVSGFIHAGLGNQLFIIFATLATAKRDGIIAKLKYSPQAWKSQTNQTPYNQLITNLEFTNFEQTQIETIFLEKQHNQYEEIPVIRQNTLLVGYFQSRFYLDPISDMIVETMQLQRVKDQELLSQTLTKLRDLAGDKQLIFIHVRRGDYLKMKWDLPFSYYQEAINWYREKFPNKCFFLIFSDDMNYCRTNFSHENLGISDPIWLSDISEDYIELMLMSECDAGIISNSTFSWWAIYLRELKNNHQPPLCVSPKLWKNGKPENLPEIEEKYWHFLDTH